MLADDTRAVRGLIVFLIADVRGYTRFTNERGDEAAARLAARFMQLARQAIETYQGTVLEVRGDEVLAVFASARGGLRAAATMQALLANHTSEDLPLHAGIGLDAGEPVALEG